MNDNHKTKAELIKELEALRQQAAHWEEAESKTRYAEGAPTENQKRGVSIDVAERSLAVENLQKWAYIFEYADWGVGIVAAEGKTLVLMNPAFARMHGYTEEELVGRPITEVFAPEYLDKVHEQIWMANEKDHHIFESKHIRKDGTVFPVQIDVTVVKDKEGRVQFRAVHVQDITTRKEAEEEMLESERRYRLLVDSSLDAVLLTNPDGGVLKANPAACQIFGYTEDEIRKLGRFGIVDNSDPRLPSALEERSKTGKFRGELTLIRKDGTKFPGEISTAVFRDKEDHLRTSMVIRDITRRKQVLERLRESEEKYRTILESIEDGYYEVDLAGNFTFFNDALTRIHEYSRDKMMSMNTRQYTDEENARKVYRDYNQVYRTGEPHKGTQYEIITKTGGRKNVETSISLIRDSSDQPIGFRGIVRDVTELRQAQNALQTSEERFRIAAQSSNDFIYEWDLNTAQIDWFGDATERLNYLLGEIPVTTTAFGKIIYPDDYERFLEPIRRHLKHGGPYKEEYRIVGKEGRIIFVKVAGMGLRDQEGRVYKWIGAISDISEQKTTEEELKQSLEKLRKAMNGIIQAMALTVETRDPYTAGHQQRVADLARSIAHGMGLPEDQEDGLRMAGMVHDLGKIGIPAEILSKPSQLSDTEFSMIKGHPQISYDILKDIDFPWPVAQIIFQHHERINGSGYPLGLSGEAICLEARILAVADVVEATSSHRPYRPAHGIDEALEEISKNKGILYDPEVVDICLRLFKDKGYKF